jgi:hypothetical protein
VYFYSTGSGTKPGTLLASYTFGGPAIPTETYTEFNAARSFLTLTGSSFWMGVSDTGAQSSVRYSGLGEFSTLTVGTNPTTTWFDGTAVARATSNLAGNLEAYGGGTSDGLGFIVSIVPAATLEVSTTIGLGLGLLMIVGLFLFGRRRDTVERAF